MTDELDEIRKRKLAQLQAKQNQAIQEQEQLKEQITQLEALVKQFLTKDALTRYGNLKIAHQEKAIRVLAILGQMIQNNQIKSQITDSQFKEILKRLEPEKKQFKIKRI